MLRTLDVFASLLKGHCILMSQKVHILISSTRFCTTNTFPNNQVFHYQYKIPGGTWWCQGPAGPPLPLGRCRQSRTQRWRWSGDSASSPSGPLPAASQCSEGIIMITKHCTVGNLKLRSGHINFKVCGGLGLLWSGWEESCFTCLLITAQWET